MKSNPEPITLFFDYDGTLHECIRIYAPAFRKVYQEMVAAGIAQPRQFSEPELCQWLGLSVPDMWNKFMPDLAQSLKDHYSSRIGDEMLQLILDGSAALYPGTEETLDTLKSQGCQMVFLSNCLRSYMEAHRQAFQLDRYFSAFFCAEDFPGHAKWEIYQTVRGQFPGRHVIIGDRKQDLECAEHFGLPFVGCSYGYSFPGELADATLLISSVTDLVSAVPTVTET